MKKKKITLLAVVLATAAMFTGCTIEDEYVPRPDSGWFCYFK